MENEITKTAFVYLSQDDKVLLLQEGGHMAHGLWSLPGGHIDEEETEEQAAIREANEESGYEVSLSEVVYRSIIPKSEYKGSQKDTEQVDLVIFRGVIKGGMMRLDNQALDLKWFDKNDALTLPHRWAFLKDIIKNS